MQTTIVSIVMMAVVLVGVQGLWAEGERSPVKPRRVIFNCDGWSVFTGAHGNLDAWVENIFGPLEDSHVDALFWCDGSGGNTARYDSDVLEPWGQRIGETDPVLMKWIAEGNDPAKVVVREGHKRGIDVFYSFRINDIHDSFESCAGEFPTYKAEHPEWMIGEGHPYGYPTALKFDIPEVRAIKLAVIKELFQKWDFDGVEIDFMRGVPHFVPGTEPQNAHILTEFLREVRQHLDLRGEERGRRIELAVRVDENLETCHLDGFDVETWIKEELMDILVVGAGAGDITVEEFKELAASTSVLVYPCLEAYGAAGSKYRPRSEGVRRALALNYWNQGADGIYTFNWFPHLPGRAYEASLLKEIGDPNAMGSKPLVFPAECHLTRLVRNYPHNWAHGVLPAELTEGQTVVVPILVGEDLVAAAQQHPLSRLELSVECSNLTTHDSLSIALNDQGLLWQSRENGVITVALTPQQLTQGRNYVSLRLAQRGPQRAVTVTATEIHVDYQ